MGQIEVPSDNSQLEAIENVIHPLEEAIRPAPRRVGNFGVKVPVECQKCRRVFEIDHYPFTPNRIQVQTRGAILMPYLQEILDEELGPQPALVPSGQPPTHVPSCSHCNQPTLPREGSTFKQRSRWRKGRTAGGRGRWPRGPEVDPETTCDLVDQKLTEAFRKSSYGSELEHANEQSGIREQLYHPQRVKEAVNTLNRMSLREIEQRWNIPRMTAARGKKALEAIIEPCDDKH